VVREDYREENWQSDTRASCFFLNKFTSLLGSLSDRLSYVKFKAKWKNYFDNELLRKRVTLKSYGFSHYTRIFKSAVTVLFNVASNLSYNCTACNMQGSDCSGGTTVSLRDTGFSLTYWENTQFHSGLSS
jgi:hypothetical protein